MRRAGVSDYLEVLRSGVLKKKVRTVVGARSHLMAEIYKEAEAGWDLYAKVNPDILPQEDIDALLTATDGEVADGDHCSSDLYSKGGYTPSSDSTSIVCSYDFKHPARVNKDQLRTREHLHDNFARLLRPTFSGAFRAVVAVRTRPPRAAKSTKNGPSETDLANSIAAKRVTFWISFRYVS